MNVKHVFSLLLVFSSALFHQTAMGRETIRVAIADDQPAVTLSSSAVLKVEGPGGGPGEKRLVFKSALVAAHPIRISSASAFIQVNGKSYRGKIELRKKSNGLMLVVNDLDLEDYLMGVVGAEMPHDWEREALKAQAVASRSYALYQKKMTGAKPYHILATVDSQMYIGRVGERESAVKAVRETEGIVITYAGEVIPAFYHSSCGGHTENANELWNIEAPYLRGVDCECQEISRYGLWEKRLSTAGLIAALRKLGYHLNSVESITIDGITQAGRVKQIAIRHAQGAVSVPAEKFRSAVGYSIIPSIFFETEQAGNEIIISGRGLGHGVGLCQWGAKEMAQRGRNYQTILKHYYPGTKLVKKGSR